MENNDWYVCSLHGPGDRLLMFVLGYQLSYGDSIINEFFFGHVPCHNSDKRNLVGCDHA